jgi:dipeptidyl aminopeptidase/acylaminoacyl peptidase
MRAHGIFLALLAGSSVAAQPNPAPVGLAAFTVHPRFTDAKISPRGTYLAAISQQGGRRSLVFVNLATRQLASTLSPGGASMVGDFHWVNDERVVVELVDDDGDLAAPVSRGELYAVDATGRGGRRIFGIRAGGRDEPSRLPHAESDRAAAYVVSARPHDDRHVLIAATSMAAASMRDAAAELYLLDVYSGAKTLVTRSPIAGASFLADENGEPRIAYAFDERLVVRVYAREPGQGWSELKALRPGATPVGYFARKRTLYVNEPVDGEFVLQAVDIDTGERRPLARSRVPPSSYVFDHATARLLAIEYEPDLPTYEFVDPPHPVTEVLRGLLANDPTEHVKLVSHTRDDRLAVVLAYSDRDPGRFLLVDVARRSAEPVAAMRPWIDPAEMAEKSAFHITASDGVRIHGYFTLPPGHKPGDRPPLVVLPHGGPHFVRDHWAFHPEVQLLAHEGFAVLQVNYRGSGGYGSAYQEAGYRHWGDRMVQDVVDATRWALGKGIGDPQRVCAYGASYGAFAAVQAAILAPDLFRCVAGLSGVYDLADRSALGDFAWSRLGRGYMRTAIGDDESALRNASPALHADRLRAKVLLAHGKKDRMTPFGGAERFRDALAAQGRPPEWLVESNEGHGFYDEAARARMYARLVEFLKENTRPVQAAAASPATTAPSPAPVPQHP